MSTNIVAVNGWRERRLHIRDSIEGIDATSLKAILAYHNARDTVQATNFEVIIILQLGYVIGQISLQTSPT